jgi:hypothetical protein
MDPSLLPISNELASKQAQPTIVVNMNAASRALRYCSGNMATTNYSCDMILIVYDTIKQKRSKAIDMRFHWIRDRIRQNQFGMYVSLRIADYMTKNLPKDLHDRFTFYLVRDTTNSATHCLIAQRRL